MLPVECPPRPGEAFPSYLQRLACVTRVTPDVLYRFLGLRAGGHTRAYMHVTLPPAVLRRVADSVGCSDDELRATLLEGFPGLDVSMLRERPGRGAHRDAQRAQWLFMSGTRLCPQCVAEDDAWKNAWQLPWMYGCERHEVLLVDACDGCGRRPDLVVRAGRDSALSTLGACACGRAWAGRSSHELDAASISRQRDLMGAAANEPAQLWGTPAPGFERLAAWRASCALLAGTASHPRWSRRPYLVPPRASEDVCALTGDAEAVVTARTISDAAGLFDELMRNRAEYGEAVVWDRIARTSPLAPVANEWLRQHGRVHVRLARTQQHAFALASIDIQRIPTLADPRFLPHRWSSVRLPEEVMRRASLSLAVARLAGAGTWAEAGDLLGIDAGYAPKLVGYTLRRIGGSSAHELTSAAFDYAQSLRTAPDAIRPNRPPLAGAASLRAYRRLADADIVRPRHITQRTGGATTR